jgi:hypothetical protein
MLVVRYHMKNIEMEPTPSIEAISFWLRAAFPVRSLFAVMIACNLPYQLFEPMFRTGDLLLSIGYPAEETSRRRKGDDLIRQQM